MNEWSQTKREVGDALKGFKELKDMKNHFKLYFPFVTTCRQANTDMVEALWIASAYLTAFYNDSDTCADPFTDEHRLVFDYKGFVASFFHLCVFPIEWKLK